MATGRGSREPPWSTPWRLNPGRMAGCWLWSSIQERVSPIGLSHWQGPRHSGSPTAFCNGPRSSRATPRKLAQEAKSILEIYAPSADVPPGTVDLGYCESLFTHLPSRKTVAGKYSARDFPSIHEAAQPEAESNACRLPGTGNPTGGRTRQKCDMAPLLRLMKSGAFFSRTLRPLTGVRTCETPPGTSKRGSR